jgi:hypothetical protein
VCLRLLASTKVGFLLPSACLISVKILEDRSSALMKVLKLIIVLSRYHPSSDRICLTTCLTARVGESSSSSFLNGVSAPFSVRVCK